MVVQMAREVGLRQKRADSVLVGEVHSIGILNAGDLVGVVLNFQVSLQDLDVHDLALFWITAIGADNFQRQISVVRFDKSLHQPGHKTNSLPAHGFGLSGQSLNPRLFQRYGVAPLGVQPQDDADAANEQRIGGNVDVRGTGVMKRPDVHRPNHPTCCHETAYAGFPKSVHRWPRI